MKPFTHHNAQSMREASRLLTKYNGKAKVNAGGTDLLAAKPLDAATLGIGIPAVAAGSLTFLMCHFNT